MDIMVATNRFTPLPSLASHHAEVIQPTRTSITTHVPPQPRSSIKKTHETMLQCKNPHALTPSEQKAVIREALTNDRSIEQEMKQAIGKKKKIHLMKPTGKALKHEAAKLLNAYVESGCPVDCGDDWSDEHIEAMLRHGPHKSATSNTATKALIAETKEKVQQGYAKVVRYGDIRVNRPKKLKVSPVAMIPHKSRQFRTILDLSFRLKLKETLMPSVNSKTVQQAPAESMVQLGKSLHRIIALMANNYNPSAPFLFAKLDIKDGFWRIAVNDEDAWNFCYVLPSNEAVKDLNDVKLVVPNSLQMGWCESPPFFCAATETARDVIETLLLEVTNSKHFLPSHDLEHAMLHRSEAVNRLTAAASYVNLIEVFVDDFIGATNNRNIDHLTNLSRAMLHGIHSIFPPPASTGHVGEDPISNKKLKQDEGRWVTTKETLGWIVDGINFTIQLSPEKCKKVVKLIRQVSRLKYCPLEKFQKLAGKLQNASFGIPGGRGLFSQIHMAMKGVPANVKLTAPLLQTLADWRTFVQILAKSPTSVRLLVPDYPHLLQYTDACKLGTGGVIVPGLQQTTELVWQVEWPHDIRNSLQTNENPDGAITINDLELAGMVLGWLVLEHSNTDLTYKHIGLFCDNVSAVAWAHKGHTSKSIRAARLLRLLHIRQRVRQVSSLLPVHIAGKGNSMADVASRAFKSGKYFTANTNLSFYFNQHFPLPKEKLWTEFKVPKKLIMRVILCLRGEQCQMASLLRLPKPGKNIGGIGKPIQPNVTSALSSTQSTILNAPSCSQGMQPEFGQALSVEEIKSKFKALQTPYQPLARPHNWLANKVPSTKRRENTFFPSNDVSKASDATTHRLNHS